MSNKYEDIAVEANSIAAALEFISSSIECHDSEGHIMNSCGLAYLIKAVGVRSSGVADLCWGLGERNDLRSGDDDS